MPVYVAMLRGINLASRARVSMADLRQLFIALGHADATTYLQSGNVVFTAGEREPVALAGEISQRIADELGLRVSVLVRTGAEMSQVLAANPFLAGEDDLTTLHVTFLAGHPDRAAVDRFGAPAGEPARFAVIGREVFLHCPEGYGRSKLSNAYIERKLGVPATTRNWKTTTKLAELSTGAG